MAIITISRGSYSKGKEVAEVVARKLEYDCVGRENLLEVSNEHDVPEEKLLGIISHSLSAIDDFPGGKDRYIAYIQAALTSRVKKDDVVYHGLAGHFLLKGVSHVLKVRIIAPLEYRINVVMERDNVSEQKALRILKKDDEERYRWSRKLFLIDQRDCELYDLVLNIDKCSVDNAADLIFNAVEFKGFATTPESQKAMDDLQLACAIKARLIDMNPNIEVSADSGKVLLKTGAQGGKITSEINEFIKTLPGVKDVSIQVRRFAPLD